MGPAPARVREGVEIRQVRKVVGASEIPVPEGHARRHKGMTHLLVKREDANAVLDRMRAAFGEPAVHGATHRFSTDQHGDRCWLTMPNQDAPDHATISF